MKKIITSLLILLLVGCSNKDSDENLKIVVPSGAPSLAFYNQIDNPNFYTADAQSIIPEFASNNTDIIVIDAINGIKAASKSGNYSLAGIITFGNFYLASTGLDDDGVLNDGDYIVVFSKGATPDYVFHYLYGTSLDSNLHYVPSAKDAGTCLNKAINIYDEDANQDSPYVEYVMIAEPMLSVSLAQNENASIYQNIQELYNEKSNGKSMIQAGVFVSNSLNKDIKEEFLNNLQKSIDELLKTPGLFEKELEGIEEEQIKDIFSIPSLKIASKVLTSNSIGLGYKKAYDIKDDIEEFASIFGLEKINEEIYYK